MPRPRTSHTFLLASDSRQTALAAFAFASLQRTAYSAYGQQSEAIVARTGFNGQLREPQGWYHLGNGFRVYNPVLMRFHRCDPLSPFGKGGLNAYAYCVGDPINYTDPTGQFTDWLIKNPAHSALLNVGLSALNLLALFLPTPPGFLGPLASFIGIGGGIAGATGAGLQLVGVKEGRHLSVAGTLSSIVGVGLKVGLSLQVVLKNPEKAMFNFNSNLHKLHLRKAPKPIVPKPSSDIAERIIRQQRDAQLIRRQAGETLQEKAEQSSRILQARADQYSGRKVPLRIFLDENRVLRRVDVPQQ